MISVGIDPGLRVTGIAILDSRLPQQLAGMWELKGVQGAGNDYAKVTKAAVRLAREVLVHIDNIGPDHIGIETFIDQGAARKRLSYRWQTPLVIGAIAAELTPKWIEKVRWQHANEILSQKNGYGLVSYLAQQGRLPKHGITEPVSEHLGDALAHAMWAESLASREVLFA